jgi:hypothetical protein
MWWDQQAEPQAELAFRLEDVLRRLAGSRFRCPFVEIRHFETQTTSHLSAGLHLELPEFPNLHPQVDRELIAPLAPLEIDHRR